MGMPEFVCEGKTCNILMRFEAEWTDRKIHSG